MTLKLILNDVNVDHTIIIVNGFDDLSCNDHKIMTGMKCYYILVMEFDDPQPHNHMHDHEL